ncbi:MAG: sel1 repeat family protein [Nitrospira sp.]|nr:MAG: sel1 repeat family protein [Nitrospira sp.]
MSNISCRWSMISRPIRYQKVQKSWSVVQSGWGTVHRIAQYNLARLYYSGQGGRQDYTQGCLWYEKAALQGSADAQVNLGTLYSNGLGCRKDDKEAVFWFLLAAKQGHGLAFVKLGSMYEDGRGATQDYVQAYKWYNLGARQNEKTGEQLRDELVKRMTPAQVAEAQQLTKEWLAGGP